MTTALDARLEQFAKRQAEEFNAVRSELALIPSGPKGDQGDPGADGVITAELQGLADDAANSVSLAQNAATAAAASAAEVAAAGLPGFASITGDAPPGLNVGVNGDFYTDSVAKAVYGPKSSAGWPAGVPFTGTLQTIAPKQVIDLRYGSLGTVLTCARASAATNLIYTDAPGASYQTFANNAPIWRSDLGVGSFTNCTNFFLNSTAPATQTITLAVGTFILWGNGSGTLAAAAGTAIGTGFGTLATLQGNFLTLVITTAGTVTVTVTGSVNAAQLEGTDLAGNGRKGPTPLIVTAGASAAREAQTLPFAGSLLALLQGAAGTIIVETAAVGIGSPAQASRFMVVNGQPLLYAATTTLIGYFRTAGTNFNWTSSGNVQTDTMRHGLAWSGSSMSAVTGGGTLVTNANAFNDSVAVTTAHLGSDTQSQTTNGWFKRIIFWTSRLSDTDLRNATSGVGALAPALSNYVKELSIPRWKAAKQQVVAGQRNAIVAVLGDSQTVAPLTGTNARASCWPMQMAALLATQTGLPVGTDSWFGYNNSGGTWTTWDTRMATTGTIGTSWGATYGGSFVRMQTGGATVAFTPTRAVDTYKVWYTTNVGNGSFTVSDGAGNTSAAQNCNLAASVQSFTMTRTSSSNAWTITSTGEVHIIGGHAYLSTQKEISLFIGSRSGWGAATFTSSGSAVIENNAALVMPSLGIDCLLLALTLNDPTIGTTVANYQTYMTALANAVKNNSGDVVFTSCATPNWGVGGYPLYAAELPYLKSAQALAYTLGAPFIDQVTRWGINGYASFNPQGWYEDNAHMKALGAADLAIDPAAVLAA